MTSSEGFPPGNTAPDDAWGAPSYPPAPAAYGAAPQSYGAVPSHPVAPAYGETGGYPVGPVPGGLLPVPPHALASPGQRFAGLLLSCVLVVVTLFIGYFVWAVVAWTKSTTPAKQVLGLRVIDARTGAPASFGQMVMRQVLWTLVLGFGSSVTIGILGIVDAFFVFGDTRQRLLDRMAGTLVVRI